MLSLSAYSCREAFLINYIIKKLEKCKKWLKMDWKMYEIGSFYLGKMYLSV